MEIKLKLRSQFLLRVNSIYDNCMKYQTVTTVLKYKTSFKVDLSLENSFFRFQRMIRSTPSLMFHVWNSSGVLQVLNKIDRIYKIDIWIGWI